MSIRLGIMPGIVSPASLTELAANVVRVLITKLKMLTWTLSRAVGKSENDHSASAVWPMTPIAEELHCPLTFVGAHVRKYPTGNAWVISHDSEMLGEPVCQCLLYDSAGPDARLIGVEYQVSDEVYRKMPAEEKLYWHAHRRENDAGFLRRPSRSDAVEETTLVKDRVLWGKIYRTWVSGSDYPRGPASPFWSDTGELPLILPRGARAQLGKLQPTG